MFTVQQCQYHSMQALHACFQLALSLHSPPTTEIHDSHPYTQVMKHKCKVSVTSCKPQALMQKACIVIIKCGEILYHTPHTRTNYFQHHRNTDIQYIIYMYKYYIISQLYIKQCVKRKLIVMITATNLINQTSITIEKSMSFIIKHNQNQMRDPKKKDLQTTVLHNKCIIILSNTL